MYMGLGGKPVFVDPTGFGLVTQSGQMSGSNTLPWPMSISPWARTMSICSYALGPGDPVEFSLHCSVWLRVLVGTATAKSNNGCETKLNFLGRGSSPAAIQ